MDRKKIGARVGAIAGALTLIAPSSVVATGSASAADNDGRGFPDLPNAWY